MASWVLPFIITVSYTVIAVILGFCAKGDLDMNKMENWGNSGNTIGFLTMFFLIGAGQVSAFTFMGAPGWAVSKGVAAFYVVVYLALMNFTIYLVNPRITDLAANKGLTTQAQTFGARYESKGVRALGAILGSVALIAYAEVQIVGCGYVLNIMSGGHLPTWLAEVLILIAIFVYVFRSGIRAVGFTNVLQGVLMFVISVTVGIWICVKFTGSPWCAETFTRILNDPELAPSLTLPGLAANYPPIYWSTSILVCMISIWPSFWVMASSGKDPEESRKGTSFVPIYQLVMIPMIVVGFVCLFAMDFGDVPPDKQALSLAMESLPWWLVGLLGAGTLAAAQSSSEPLFQTLAYTWTHDVFGPLCNWSEEKQGKIQRWLLLPFMFGIVLPLSITNPAQLVNILLVGYGFLAQIFPMHIGIWVWPRATKAGAVWGLLVGSAVTLLFSFGPLANYGGIHGGIYGLVVNIILLIVISLVTKPAKRETLELFFSDEWLDKAYETEEANA